MWLFGAELPVLHLVVASHHVTEVQSRVPSSGTVLPHELLPSGLPADCCRGSVRQEAVLVLLPVRRRETVHSQVRRWWELSPVRVHHTRMLPRHRLLFLCISLLLPSHHHYTLFLSLSCWPASRARFTARSPRSSAATRPFRASSTPSSSRTKCGSLLVFSWAFRACCSSSVCSLASASRLSAA